MLQTSLDELIVFNKKQIHKLPELKEVLAEVPCLSCPESLETHCDIEGCMKLTAWLGGHP